MKILYIAHVVEIGGASIALLNIIKGLPATIEVGVMLPAQKGWLIDELKQCNCRLFFSNYEIMVYPIAPIRKYGRWNPIGYLKFCKGLYKKFWKRKKARKDLKNIINEFRPDIVHCNCGPLTFSLKVCQKMDVAHVWHLREYIKMDMNMNMMPSFSLFKKELKQQGNHCIAITKGIFDFFELQKERDEAIYDGVFDIPQQKKFIDYAKENYILAAGRIEPAKGTLMLLEAFCKFYKNHSHIKLLLAGGFSNPQYLEQCNTFVSENHLEESVLFLGERNDVYQLMQKARFLVVASPSEAFGFITAEAMLNSCLVIGRNTAGTKEQFDNGLQVIGEEIGLRFETTEELMNRMEYALNNPDTHMREKAFEVVTHKYTIQSHIQHLMSFYNKLLDKKNAENQYHYSKLQ